MIFTSPSSAKGNIDVTEASADPQPSQPSRPRRRHGKTASKRAPVATKLMMDGRVTVRAIAYTAVQVRHSLRSAFQAYRLCSLSSISLLLMPPTGRAITTGSTMKNFMSLSSTFSKPIKQRKGGPLPRNLLTGGISTSIILHLALELALMPPQASIPEVRRNASNLVYITASLVAFKTATTAPNSPSSCTCLVPSNVSLINPIKLTFQPYTSNELCQSKEYNV